MNDELLTRFIEFIKDKTFDDANELTPVKDIEANRQRWAAMNFNNKK